MSVTSGFFNSVNHDRRYNAAQMSAIFDGIINDGVFANIGVAFAVSAHTGVTISIGKGRAWFNSAWVYNDGPLLKTLEGSEVVLDRIDAVVIEVDHNENVRLGDIKIVKGTPASTPQRPKMAADTYKHQYPLAYIYRKAGSTTITQADITSMIGTSSCPYITGILQVQNIDNIVAQWGAQWNQWYSEMVAETNADASELMAEMRSEFDIWLNDLHLILDADIATKLGAQVVELMGKFDDLARDACVYDTIEDSDLDVILGSDGTPIQGKTVFSGSGSGSIEGVTAKDIGAIAIDGSTPMTGNLDVNQNRIMNVAEPEEDSDAATVRYVLDRVKDQKDFVQDSKPTRNLLINSDFRNPVNQRGSTGYSGSQFTIDKWFIWSDADASGSLSVEDGGIALNPSNASAVTLSQRFPAGYFGNKKYTLAYCDIYGNIFINNNPVILHQEGFEYVQISTSEWNKFIWAALYEGEYTLETLPKYQPNGYENELLACRQYDPVTGEYIGLRKFGTAHNLLDNSDFTNPVNQKGQTSYSGNVYGIDRWVGRVVKQTVTVEGQYVTVTVTGAGVSSGIKQKIADISRYAGRTVTLAVKVYSTTPVSVGFVDRVGTGETTIAEQTETPNDTRVILCTYTVPSDATPDTFISRILLRSSTENEYMRLYWAALYEGEYTIDTLPEYQPKGYEQELLICNQCDPITGNYIGLRKFGQPHNLLDNSDFTKPVNQKGQTSYTGDYSYFIDRWTRTANGTVTLVSNGVQLAASSAGNVMISQDIAATPDMAGKSFTLAYCTGGGVVGCVTFPITTIDVSSNVALSGNIVTDGNSIGYVYLIPNRTLRIQLLAYRSKTAIFRWVALYEGVYSVDTLPDYVPKERAVEERNCGIVPFVPDLLWQNASVASQFDPQTIALDLSTYAWLILEWSFSTDSDNRYTMLIPTRDASKHEMHINATSQNRDGGRLVSVNGNNVVFEAGKYNTSTNNKNVIPTRIWGLKEATA